MKKLALILAFLSACASADTIATLENKGGGLIVLTDVICRNESGYYVYSQQPSAATQFGCWWSDDSMVHVTWSDGDVWSYPISHFRINPTKAQKMRERENRNKKTF